MTCSRPRRGYTGALFTACRIPWAMPSKLWGTGEPFGHFEFEVAEGANQVVLRMGPTRSAALSARARQLTP